MRAACEEIHSIFRTPLPQEALASGSLLLWLLMGAASTRHPQTRPRIQGVANQLLFVREMVLRLPAPLLARHLWHKAIVGLQKKEQVPG